MAGIPWDHVPTDEADLARCLADPMWRVCSGQLYRIIVKSNEGDEGKVMPFRPNRAQRKFISRLWHRNIILKARQLGFCLDPSMRVLTADLRWIPIGDIKPGTKVVSVDEHPPGGKGQSRKMRTAVVEASRRVFRKAYRIRFDDGREVVCTGLHPWLTRKAGTQAEWRSIEGKGNQVVGRIKVGTQVRWVTKPWDAPGYEDGWMGGMLDGEGSMAKACASGAEINVSQVEGPAFARMAMYLDQRGYHYRTEEDAATRPSKLGGTPVHKLCVSRMDEVFRLIGQTRPSRFIGRQFWDGKELPGKRNGDVGWATVTSIEELGEQEMVDLQTSTGTYIAEGFVSHNTTLVCILWLDHALFNANQRCAIIAQDLPSAQAIFRDKVKFAYDQLPPALREQMPLAKDSETELLFAHNNSSVKVATSVRSGTIDRLHVSEFGKICAKYPAKATEVMTGSLPAVPLDGIAIIESTSEGQGGAFHEMCKAAQALQQQGKALTRREWRMHFFPWWEEDGYELDPAGVVISQADHDYFDELEAEIGRAISNRKRAWYVATRDADFAGADEKMWQEYPSTPAEAFQRSSEGTYYSKQLAAVRKTRRITTVPYVPGIPVNTFWDIGARDGTALWFHQQVGHWHNFLLFAEGWGEPYGHFTKIIQDTGWTFGTHYLPHDAAHRRQLGVRVASPIEMLQELLPGHRFEIVPQVDRVIDGIQLARDGLAACQFDEEGCKAGLIHLSEYRKEWDQRLAVFKDNPRHDEHSEAADAFRQWAQARAGGLLHSARQRVTRPASRRSGMVV